MDEPLQNPFAERVKTNSLPLNILPESPALSPAESPPTPGERADQIQILDGEMKLSNIEQVWRAAKLIRQSGLVPPSFRNDQQIVIAILRAIELKIPIFQALEGMTVIQNKIGIMGDLALALVQASGELKEIQKTYSGEAGELTCTVTIQRKGRKAHEYTFSVAEARAAGIYDRSAVWKSYPRRMTYYRALGFALRDEFPDILKGIKTTEELADYPENSNAR